MEGDKRREQIIQLLSQSREPVSGTELAGKMHVSRQIIVQDIALLRAGNKNILSTNKGYIIFTQDEQKKVRRTFKVKHTDEEIRDELNIFVDLGGRVLDVVVEHEIYGQITVDLILNSRADVNAFVTKLKQTGNRPLNELTHGVHFHTIEADREDILDAIEAELSEKGYLMK
ncbi:MAG: transcription repressor NadR [Lachnospiraceae bacterium]|nr:transcription repressor NadR [Lachnospiraceae bacterium]